MLPRSERTRDSMAEPTANERTYDRLTVADAARLLGLSAEAVRMRIKRGTLASEKVGGTVYVLLDTNPTPSNADRTTDRTAETRSEEHTSELQSRQYLVCRLLLEKKKQ